MEGKGRVGASQSSSFTAQIFGPKGSTASANFNSIFPPPSGTTARNILSHKHGSLEQHKESATYNLSSSLYYGGQDIYSQSTHNRTYTTINKDQVKDDNDANKDDNDETGGKDHSIIRIFSKLRRRKT